MRRLSDEEIGLEVVQALRAGAKPLQQISFDMELLKMQQVLIDCRGNVTEAAIRLNMQRTTLATRIADMGFLADVKELRKQAHPRD